jgi:hypothetical protein
MNQASPDTQASLLWLLGHIAIDDYNACKDIFNGQFMEWLYENYADKFD